MTHFNFEEWAALNAVDPEAFEIKREAALRQVINSREDDESRKLLEQTLFRIDMTRQKAKSPLQAALLASNLMWDSFGKLQEKINELESEFQASDLPRNGLRLIGTKTASALDNAPVKSRQHAAEAKPSATVLSFSQTLRKQR